MVSGSHISRPAHKSSSVRLFLFHHRLKLVPCFLGALKPEPLERQVSEAAVFSAV
jgi:hypothetical protein